MSITNSNVSHRNQLKLKVYYSPSECKTFITHAYENPNHLVKEIWKNNPRKVVVEFLTCDSNDKFEVPRGQKIFTKPFELGKELKRWLDCLKVEFNLAGILFCYDRISLPQFVPLSDDESLLKLLTKCLDEVEFAYTKFLEDELHIYLVTGLGTVIPITVSSRTWFDGARELVRREVEAFVKSVDTPFTPTTAVMQEPAISEHGLITTVWRNSDLIAFHVNPDEAHRDFYDSFYSELLSLDSKPTRVVKDQDGNTFTLYDLPRLVAFTNPKQDYTCIDASGEEKVVSSLNEAIVFLEVK